VGGEGRSREQGAEGVAPMRRRRIYPSTPTGLRVVGVWGRGGRICGGRGGGRGGAEDEGLLEEALVLSAPSPVAAPKKPKKAKPDGPGRRVRRRPPGPEGARAARPRAAAAQLPVPPLGCNKAYIHE